MRRGGGITSSTVSPWDAVLAHRARGAMSTRGTRVALDACTAKECLGILLKYDIPLTRCQAMQSCRHRERHGGREQRVRPCLHCRGIRELRLCLPRLPRPGDPGCLQHTQRKTAGAHHFRRTIDSAEMLHTVSGYAEQSMPGCPAEPGWPSLPSLPALPSDPGCAYTEASHRLDGRHARRAGHRWHCGPANQQQLHIIPVPSAIPQNTSDKCDRLPRGQPGKRRCHPKQIEAKNSNNSSEETT